ncbi:PilT/PilU family type 4a pilus ATPase [Elusimicrobiota bacterium]
MENIEKRKEKRHSLRIKVNCEKLQSNGIYDPPIAVDVRDISYTGLSFYSAERLNINTHARLTMWISDTESVSFEGRVTRVAVSEKREMQYLVGMTIDNIDKSAAERISGFIGKMDIDTILDSVDLGNIMDLHFVSGYPPIIKKGTKLFTFDREPFSEFELRNILLSMLDENRYLKFMREKEFNFVWTTKKGMRFRVNLHFQRNKIEGTFRLIPSEIGTPAQVGIPKKVVENLLMNKKGLILIAGRTGSGKSTTLASMIEFLNNRRNSIIVTIEDPIEFIYENKGCIIKQREVGRDTISYYTASKNALRQNPDILVVGEILDMETMETAITAAETGTLVITSIHAGSSAQALDRVTSFFPADMQRHILQRLSLILRGVISQELIPRADDDGLVLATEITIVTSAIRRIIRDADWNQIPSLIQLGRNLGMQTMQHSLEQLYDMGLIDEEYVNPDT